MTVDTLRLGLEIVIALILVGRWVGARDVLDSRRPRVTPAQVSAPPTPTESNGKPTLYELTRRVEDLERDGDRYVLKVEAQLRFENNQREHEELRTQIRGTQRRIERIEGMTAET